MTFCDLLGKFQISAGAEAPGLLDEELIQVILEGLHGIKILKGA